MGTFVYPLFFTATVHLFIGENSSPWAHPVSLVNLAETEAKFISVEILLVG
jgi:hypothetical protein